MSCKKQTRDQELYEWLNKNYEIISDNAELKSAHHRGIMKAAIRTAIMGCIFVFLALVFIWLATLNVKGDMLVEMTDTLTRFGVGMCCIVALVCLWKSLELFCIAQTGKYIEVQEGRGFIPVDLIEKIRKEGVYNNESENGLCNK